MDGGKKYDYSTRYHYAAFVSLLVYWRADPIDRYDPEVEKEKKTDAEKTKKL